MLWLADECKAKYLLMSQEAREKILPCVDIMDVLLIDTYTVMCNYLVEGQVNLSHLIGTVELV